MMLNISYRTKFKKELERQRKRGKDISKIKIVIEKIIGVNRGMKLIKMIFNYIPNLN